MYYPSRIRQLLDVGDTISLSEVTSYYRELYGVLSLQAMRQIERTHLHLRPIEKDSVTILGDENLIRYLFEILRKRSGSKKPDIRYRQIDEYYVEVRFAMPALCLTEQQATDLFNPSREHIPYLLCRQIVRDHGEATNRRGCGIRAEIIDNSTVIIIILPAAKKQ
jgi:hypothetical protein